jgi:septal ring factor EnvC (AmiA/AmiB activator)
MRCFPIAVILALLCFCGSGCIAYQIRDESQITNRQLVKMNTEIDKLTADLAQVNSSLIQTNEKLEKSDNSIAAMEIALDPIRISVRRIDDELAGFRQILDKMDRYMPVNLKADTPLPARQPPTQQTTPNKQ